MKHEVEVRDSPLPGTAPEWMPLAQERFGAGQVVEGGEDDQDLQEAEATLAQVATDQALRPYLAWAAEQMLSYVDQERWRRGYCPICGGAPDFAMFEAETGARHLMCTRCNGQWIYRRVGCSFCGTTDHTKLMYYPSEDEAYRLYVCQACQHYLKTMDLRRASRAVLLTVERIVTVAMDAAARQEGYR